MTVHATSQFKQNAARALADEQLQKALGNVKQGFIDKRQMAADKLPEFEALRDAARDIKNHTLEHLDLYLEAYEEKVRRPAARAFRRNAEEARDIILDICREAGAKTVTKGKSMISEEIGLNASPRSERHRAGRDRSRRIHHPAAQRDAEPHHRAGGAPQRTQVEAGFPARPTHLDAKRDLSEPVQLLTEARAVLRERFLAADVGITGANFLVAETGTSIIVTNEGNGDLTQILPKTHIVLASIEKLVPTLEDVSQILRVLARSATGQEMSVYTTFSTGPRRAGDRDGPENYHVVILDNGRSAMLGTELRGDAALHPLRRLHEPLPGLSRGRRARLWLGLSRPDGRGADAVADRRRQGGPSAQRLDLLRRCESVCPVRIPLPKLMRHWREREFERHLTPATVRSGLKLWGLLRQAPWPLSAGDPRRDGGGSPAASAAASPGCRWRRGWTKYRDFPAPQGETFQAR